MERQADTGLYKIIDVSHKEGEPVETIIEQAPAQLYGIPAGTLYKLAKDRILDN